MTDGHEHRTLWVYETDLLYRLLRKPLIHERYLPKIERSRFVYGPCTTHVGPYSGVSCYTLSLLGILHGLFGLTLETREPE